MHIIVRQTLLHSYAAFIVFSFFTSFISQAQTQNDNLMQFTKQDGWPGSKLVPLLQDKFGCIWAGTNNALTFYEFERFYSNHNNLASNKALQSKLFEHEVAFILKSPFLKICISIIPPKYYLLNPAVIAYINIILSLTKIYHHEKTTSFSFLFATLVVSSVLMTSCQPAKPDLAQIRTEIQALENGYADGLNTKDANAVAVYYADDAVSMPNDQPAVSGHEALLKMIQQDIASDTINAVVSFETVDVFVAGDLVTEIGKGISKDSNGQQRQKVNPVKIFEISKGT